MLTYKMNSFLDSIVSLCGDFPYDISSYLRDAGATVVPWSPRVAALIVGADYETKWKYTTAVARGIRIVPFSTLFPSGPTDLWTDRYKPKTVADIIGNPGVVSDLMKWLRGWTPAVTPKAALLSGPPGIGKTTMAHMVARECGYDVVELNASNERSASAVKKVFEEAAGSRCVGTRRVIIMDEVDGMSSGDRGGVGELARMIRSGLTFPIICIANERTTPKLRPIVSCTLDLRCSRPTKTTIAKALMKVVAKEGMRMTVAELETMCERNGNDIRSLLNYLQFGAIAARSGAKDERIDAFSATGRLFGGQGSMDTRMNYVFTDHSLVPLMVAEGYVAAAGRGKAVDKIEAVVGAADMLGVYDMLDARIHRSQAWSMLPPATVMVAGAAAAVQGPAPFQIFPSWLGKFSKRQKHKRWHRTLARELNMTGSDALMARDLLRLRLFDVKATAGAIVDRLEDYGLSRDSMMETLVETVFTGDEDCVKLDTKLKGGISREWKKRHAADTETVGAANDDDAVSVASDDSLDGLDI